MTGRICASLGLVLALIGLPAPDSAATNLSLPVGGFVSVELVYSEAVFSNTLSLVSPAAAIDRSGCETEFVTGLPGLKLGSEKPSQRGCRVVLDADASTAGVQAFAAGTSFVFNLCAQLDADPACEYLWSSDPSLNPDMGSEHVQTTALYPAEYPGKIFQMAWEDRPEPPPDFNDLVAVVRIHQDSDGDGLWDDWETFGIDANADGIVDLDLPNLLPVDLDGDGNTNGAGEKTSPTRKDVFLEIDYMDCAVPGGDCPAGNNHSHKPKQKAVDAVVDAFADAGITLHVDLSNALPHAQSLTMGGGGTYTTIKQDPANFGVDNPRRLAFHYAIFGHSLVPASAGGSGEVLGNDFAISLGGSLIGQGDVDGDGLPDEEVGTVQTQASVLMHELGHNLGLLHGGSDEINDKPNYISVMNYAYNRGIGPADPDGPTGPLTARVDYSPSALPTLDETSLAEAAGVGGTTDSVVFWCPDWTRDEKAGAAAIDWNCDGDDGLGGDTNLQSDITGDRICIRAGGSPWDLKATPSGDDVNLRGYFIADGPDRKCDTTAVGTDQQVRAVGNSQQNMLAGYDDWANLRFDFQSDGEFQEAVFTDLAVDVDFKVEVTPEADAGPDASYECETDSGAFVFLDGSLSSDDDTPRTNDDIVLFEWLEDLGLPSEQLLGTGETLDVALPLGIHQITLRVTDTVGARDLDDVVVTVRDTTPPEISVELHPKILWPPNHRMVPVWASVQAHDVCTQPEVVLSSVTSSEPDDASGRGDGHTRDDIRGAELEAADFHFELRAERGGRGSGRSYTAVYTATDESGNESSAAGVVEVPKR